MAFERNSSIFTLFFHFILALVGFHTTVNMPWLEILFLGSSAIFMWLFFLGGWVLDHYGAGGDDLHTLPGSPSLLLPLQEGEGGFLGGWVLDYYGAGGDDLHTLPGSSPLLLPLQEGETASTALLWLFRNSSGKGSSHLYAVKSCWYVKPIVKESFCEDE